MTDTELHSLRLENESLKKKIERLSHDLIHDELTGLKTRKYIVDEVKKYLKREVKKNNGNRQIDTTDTPFAFLFCDIDHFKSVNDSLGHAGGDEVLRGVSTTLLESVRETDIVARFGGEEILIFLSNVGRASAEAIAEKIRDGVAHISFKAYPNAHVTISIGVASTGDALPEESIEDIDTMFDEYVRRADMAVYSAKETGRNKVVLWTPHLERVQHNTVVRTEER